MQRRRFLKSTLTAASTVAAATFAAPFVVRREILGGGGYVSANERVQIGLIGCGVRGKYLTANMPATGRVIALCDFHEPNMESVVRPQKEFVQPLAEFSQTDGPRCSRHVDYRRLLDSPELDAVMIATPDHHHILAAVLACQAGKDVYCEKPLSLTIAEGRVLVKAAERYRRVVQVGSQQRSMAANMQGCEFIRRGGLGKIHLVEIKNLPGPMPIDRLPGEAGTPEPHWDLFCGPAPSRTYHRDLWVKDAYKHGYLTWRGWDLFRDYSGHLMTNWGGHSVDMVQLALGTDHTGPVEIQPLTEVFEQGESVIQALDDQWHDKTPPLGTVPDRRQDRQRFCPVSLKYAHGVELRLSPGLREDTFHGERGQMVMSRNRFQVSPRELAPPPLPVAEMQRWSGAGHVARPHIENWLECIKSRQTPLAPVEAGHRTATICHLVNIARELGRPLRWNPETESFEGDSQANSLRDRPRRPGWELPPV